MSWLKRLLSKSSAGKAAQAPASAKAQHHPATGPDDHARRKSQRALHREQLHAVVRECMAMVGVLSSHYKFKVLTVDRESTQFVVMIDMLSQVAPDREGLTNMEASIAHKAMSLRGMRVIAVYWRMTDQAATLRPRTDATAVAVEPAPDMSPPPAPARSATRTGKAQRRESSASGFPETDPRALGGTQYGDLG